MSPRLQRAGRPLSVTIDGFGTMPVSVTRRRNTRNARLRVTDEGEVALSAPMHATRSWMHELLVERTAWIARQLQRVREDMLRTAVDVHAGDPIRLLGQWVPVQVHPAGGSRSRVDIMSDEIVIRLCADDHDRACDILIAAMRRHARTIIEERVAHWSEHVGVRPTSVSIRNQRTRWGSCSSRGSLSFNWRLVMAPMWVLDAIVVHELCHLIELNHSQRFWTLVHRSYPRHDEAQEWLGAHGGALAVRDVRSIPGPEVGGRGHGRLFTLTRG